MKTYEHVARAVFGQPWMIRPEILDQVAALTRFRAEGGFLTDAEIRARLAGAAAAAGPRGGARTVGAVGIIPIYGAIFPRANMMTEFSGGATVAGIRSSFRQALEDETVGSILLEFDSPGGMVDGVEELATEIREARGRKPITAIANYAMASAAYYLGSQADEVVASPSAMVGWVGAVAAHTEFSRQNETEGVTTTIFRDPPGKGGANEFEPLSDQARAELQQMVDDYSGQFHAAVAKARGVSVATVRRDYGQGGGMTAARAKAAGLVDRVESLDATVRRLATGKGPAPRRPGASAGAAIDAAVGPILMHHADDTEEVLIPDADGMVTLVGEGAGDPLPPIDEATIPDNDQPATEVGDDVDVELLRIKSRARAR